MTAHPGASRDPGRTPSKDATVRFVSGTAEVTEKARRSQRAWAALRPLRSLRVLRGHTLGRGPPAETVGKGRAVQPLPAWVPAFAGMSGLAGGLRARLPRTRLWTWNAGDPILAKRLLDS